MTRDKEIIHKYLKGECTREELKKSLSLFTDSSKQFEIRSLIYDFYTNEDKDNFRLDLSEKKSLLNEIYHRINLNTGEKKIFLKKHLSNILKFAAVLIIGLVTGIMISLFQRPGTEYYTSIAPEGSISQIVLPDSTLVALNSGSEIKYAINSKKKIREIFLNGEAWFDVKKNKKRTFVVHTSFYDVMVMGTQFNVKAYTEDNEIVTTLEKGSVNVVSSGNFKMKSRILKPGEQLVYNVHDNFLETNKVNTRIYTSWKENKLIFINMNLSELIVLLERKYGVDIEVERNITLDYHYDGTFRNETILEVMDILKETLPVDYKIEGQKIIIQKK
jgi:transmembrane sensor